MTAFLSYARNKTCIFNHISSHPTVLNGEHRANGFLGDVIPAKAGIHSFSLDSGQIPAEFSGMTYKICIEI